MYTTVPTSMIRAGAVLKSPIFDENRTMLLAAGLTVTASLLEHVHKRGIRSVLVARRDLARVYCVEPRGVSDVALPDRRNVCNRVVTPQTRALDSELAAMTDLTAGPQGEPFSLSIHQPGSVPYDSDQQVRFVEEHEASLEQIKTLSGHFSQRRTPDLKPLEKISSAALSRIVADKDLFVCLGVTPYYTDYPGRHSMHTASLAIAMGATLGLDERTLLDLAIGCLLHDFGMTRIDPNTYLTRRRLNDLEFLEITKHPILTFDMIEQASQHLSARSRMVAYQIHERSNGTGYPRGRHGDQIHELAKIAAVADTYVALVAPRPHRPGMLPYFAMEKVLHGVNDGLYDPRPVRALLETVCLFPIGSYVELNDSRVGKVIRSNGQHYDRPVLEVWKRDELTKEPALLDLASDSSYRVTKPVGAGDSSRA